MPKPKDTQIADFTYDLPEDRIAQYPLSERDKARLLIYRDGLIEDTEFRQLAGHLPERSLMVFNDTRVIHARLHFLLPNEQVLEIFCLEPLQPAEYQQNFGALGQVRWKCLVGGNRKWKSGIIEQDLHFGDDILHLQAERTRRLEDAFEIAFSWDLPITFGEVLQVAGMIPLPPYMNRNPEASDSERYQTVYARLDGSVAAPTAGLHFTEAVFDSLSQKHIKSLYVTLHVGAGTFKPVRSTTIGEHHMHQESIYLNFSEIEVLLKALTEKRSIISVGTTSTRLLESIYWHGCRLLRAEADPADPIDLPQWAPYEYMGYKIDPREALEAVLRQTEHLPDKTLAGQTQILIAPGYPFRLIDGLITNFHQPNSTLLLLVAALIGSDWQRVYDYALTNGFRFLSYGDSSLLFKSMV